MLYLYLDESGDLGFDFFAKKPSKYFTVTVMLVQGMENRKKIAKAVKRTLQNKFPKQEKIELKGSKQSIEVKKYFYRHIESVPFELYALTLNKRRVYDYLSHKKDRVYNFIARKVLDVIPFTNAQVRVGLVIDRSKSKKEIIETIKTSPWQPAELGRLECRKDFIFESDWNKRYYKIKQVKPIFVEEDTELVVITVYTYFFKKEAHKNENNL